MNAMLQNVDELFILVINILTYMIGAIGILILTMAVFKAFVGYWKHVPNDQLQLSLAKGMQFSLQFLLGGEILHTIIAESWDGILIVGAIIVLRFALNFTIHWETNCICNGHSHGEQNKELEKTAG